MRFDPLSPVIVVEVELEAHGIRRTVDMALDTGATYTVIPWLLARGLGFDPELAERHVSLATASATGRAPLLVVDRVWALGVDAAGVQVVCHDLPRSSRVRGLLGLSFLRRFDVDLHFRRRWLEARRA